MNITVSNLSLFC